MCIQFSQYISDNHNNFSDGILGNDIGKNQKKKPKPNILGAVRFH